MKSPLVRPIQDADIPGTAAALVDVHATDGYPVEGVEQPEAWLNPPGVIQSWVAELDERIVGHVAVMQPNGEDVITLWQEKNAEDDARLGVLARLFVVRAARKHAVGEGLMRSAMNFAQEHGLRLALDVMTKDAAAIRLYERMGWQRIGEAKHEYGEGQQIPAVCYVWPSS